MRTTALLVVVLVRLLLWASAAAAQTPIGPEFLLASTTEIVDKLQGGASISCNESSVCALVWASMSPDGQSNHARLWGRTLLPTGQLSALQLLRASNEGIGAEKSLPTNPGFALFGQTTSPDGLSAVPNFRFYDDTLSPLSDLIDQPYHQPPVYGDPDSIWFPGPTLLIPGGFVELSGAWDEPFESSLCTNSYACWDGVFLYFFDRQGNKLRERVAVNEDTSGDEVPGGIAVDGRGNIIVVFDRGTKTDVHIYVRRFTSAGVALGHEVQVSSGLPGVNYLSTVAASPDGEFLVVWLSNPFGDSYGWIYAQRFGADGVPLGPALRVSSDRLVQGGGMVSADSHGNYFVTWNSHDHGPYEVHGRLYRHDGSAVTRDELIVNQHRSFYDQAGGLSSFAPNGTLTVSYGTQDPAVTGGQESIPLVRRFSASPGQEICAISGSKIQCDLARTGGFPELQLTWGGRHGEVTLFGDVDGDGRDEVCSYRDGLFSCDVSHEGALPFWRERFGFPGDIPLLADVNGDGKADPCVWRKSSKLVCDTRRDGTENYLLQVGHQHGTPLLGDLDGDGKADLCLVDGSFWSCLLSSTGQLVHFTFGKGGSPALGDVNLDGKADPCFLRKGRLTCDTKHEGGAGDYTLQLDVPSGARLLFGNLDGL